MEEEGKLFIGGLSWDTNEDGLKNYFQSGFGEVTSCVIMKDPTSSKSRGFGFVTFREPSNVQKVLKVTSHTLDNRTIDPKPAVPRGSQPSTNSRAGVQNGIPRGRAPQDTRGWATHPGMAGGAQAPSREPYNGPTKKIFVGGLSPNTTEDEVKQFFSSYSTVTEVILKYDQQNNRMRGFGFVTFDNEDVVDKLVEKHYVTINNKTVEIKKAEPRTVSNPAHGQPVRPGHPQPYWDGHSGYAYPYPHHGAPYSQPASSPYYPPAGYAASPTAPYGSNYAGSYSSGAYGAGHYGPNAAAASGGAPGYGGSGYAAPYGAAGGYSSAGGPGYDAYNGSSARGGHRGGYSDSSYGNTTSSYDAHSPNAAVAYGNATGAGAYAGQAGGASVTTNAADPHGYSAVYSAEYRGGAPSGGAPNAYQQTPTAAAAAGAHSGPPQASAQTVQRGGYAAY